MFDIPPSPVSPPFKMYIRVDPSAGGVVDAGLSLPPDGKYSVYTEMSRDDFFFIYSGEASTGMVASMCLTGRMKVKWFKFHELQAFAGSFDFSTPAWLGYYRSTGQTALAQALLADAWTKTRKKGAVMDPDGHVTDPHSVDPAVLEAWEAAALGAPAEFAGAGEPPKAVAVGVSQSGEEAAAAVEQAVREGEEGEVVASPPAPSPPAMSVLVSDVAVLDLSEAGPDTHIELPVPAAGSVAAAPEQEPERVDADADAAAVVAEAEAASEGAPAAAPVPLQEPGVLAEELGAPEIEAPALVAVTEGAGGEGGAAPATEAPEGEETQALLAAEAAAAVPVTTVAETVTPAPEAAVAAPALPSEAGSGGEDTPPTAEPVPGLPAAPPAPVLVKLRDLIARGPFSVETLPPGTELEGLLLAEGPLPPVTHAWAAVQAWQPPAAAATGDGAASARGNNAEADGKAAEAASTSMLDSVLSSVSAAGKAVVDFLPFTGSSTPTPAAGAAPMEAKAAPAAATTSSGTTSWLGSLFGSAPAAQPAETKQASGDDEATAGKATVTMAAALEPAASAPLPQLPPVSQVATQADFAGQLVAAYATGVYTAALLGRDAFADWLATHSLVGACILAAGGGDAVPPALQGPAAVAARFDGHPQLALQRLPTEWQRQQWYEVAFAERLLLNGNSGSEDAAELPISRPMVAAARALRWGALGASAPSLLPPVMALARTCVQFVAPEPLWQAVFESSVAPLAPVFGLAAAASASELLAPYASVLDVEAEGVAEEGTVVVSSSDGGVDAGSGAALPFSITGTSVHAAGVEVPVSAASDLPPAAAAAPPSFPLAPTSRVLDVEALRYLQPYSLDGTPFLHGTANDVNPTPLGCTPLPPLPPEPARDVEGEALAAYLKELRGVVCAPARVRDGEALMPGTWGSSLLFSPTLHSPASLRGALACLPRVLSPLEACALGSKRGKPRVLDSLPLSDAAARVAAFWGWGTAEGEALPEPASGKRLLLTPAQAETVSWCVGSRFARRYPTAPLTLGAVQFLVPASASGSEVTEARLMPIWAPGNLRATAFACGEGSPANGATSPSSTPAAAASEAVLYAGPGSGLFYGTAVARLRLGMEPATAGTAPHGVGGSSGKLLGSADWEAGLEALRAASRGSVKLPVGGGRHVVVALTQHTSPEDEAALGDGPWDADGSAQAAALPRSSLFTLLRTDASTL